MAARTASLGEILGCGIHDGVYANSRNRPDPRIYFIINPLLNRELGTATPVRSQLHRGGCKDVAYLGGFWPVSFGNGCSVDHLSK